MQYSKARTTFVNRLLHFNDDIEFMDIVHYTVKKSHVYNDRIRHTKKLFKYFKTSRHPNINRYEKKSQHNRKLIVTHCRATIYSAYVKELYEEFTMYLRNIISEAYKNAQVDPNKIVGDQGKINMSVREILKYAQDGTLIDIVIDRLFQSLENEKSTILLINKTCEKLGLDIENGTIDDAVYYLEIRHKLVHTDGYADQEFKNKHSALKYTSDSYIDLTYDTLTTMREKVLALIDAIDSQAILKQILKPHTEP